MVIEKMTYSEKIFDRYLQQLGYKPKIDYRFDFSIDRNPPVDFYIEKSNPKIIVQIKEFNPYSKNSKRNHQLKKEMMYDGYGVKDLRKKIGEIVNQFKPYKNSANYICIGVIQDHPQFIAFKAEDIAEAMYGDLCVQIKSKYPNKYHWAFKGNGAMGATKNTRISAICSLTSAKDKADILQDEDIVKCICVLNCFSQKRIQSSFFSGQRDEVWEINKSSGRLEKIYPS